jgi:DNA-binding Lrp family transcriptional regulator
MGVSKIQRTDEILKILYEQGHIEVHEISARFGISEATARRDLHRMADEGLLEAVYGGATLPRNGNYSLHSRQARNIEAKRAIGQLAAEMVRNGDVVFIDSDLPVELESFSGLIDGLREGYSIVIGSRYHPDSQLNRNYYKTLKSRLYNWLIKIGFDTGISDHQCGFKSLKKEDLEDIILDVQDNKFFFDTELLIKARKKGLEIKEIPVTWTDTTERKSNISLREELEIVLKYIQFSFQQN